MTLPISAAVKMPPGWKHGTAAHTEKTRQRSTRPRHPCRWRNSSTRPLLLARSTSRKFPSARATALVLACDSRRGLDFPAELKSNGPGWRCGSRERCSVRGHYRAYTFARSLLQRSNRVLRGSTQFTSAAITRMPEKALVTALDAHVRGRPDAARVHALVEREVPPPGPI